MKRKFHVTFCTPEDQFWRESCMTLQTKGAHELRDAFQFLALWPEHFYARLGELRGLSHLSNPEDPPDVVAHFTSGDINIEITTIEADHVLQSDSQHRKRGGGARTEIPLSNHPTSAREAAEIMYTPGHPKAWENVSDRRDTRFVILVKRANEKFQNHRIQNLAPGILLFTGSLFGDDSERSLLKSAFQALSELPESHGWTLGFVFRWNSLSFFTALHDEESGFKFRLKHANNPLMEN